MKKAAALVLSCIALASCAGPQPTELAGTKQLPKDWLSLSADDSKVKSLDKPTQSLLQATRDLMAAERNGSAYRFYGQYSPKTLAVMESANRAANEAYLTSTRVLQNNLTPELYSTAETANEANWDWYSVTNTDNRSLRDDWARFWLVDQPSRLSPYPIESTTGNP